MSDCIFCKIVKREIPSNIVYESEYSIAFLDTTPVNPGHTLVISKSHHETLLDIPEKELYDCAKTLKKLSLQVMNSVKADGFNIGMNNFEAAGQLVKHAHFHVIPRFKDDGFKHWEGKNLALDKIRDITHKIRTFLKQS